jgi:hypothetical protein
MQKKKEEIIEVEAVEIAPISINVGGPRLLMNKLGMKKREELEDTYRKGKAQPKAKPQSVAEIVEAATHRLSDGTICFPTAGFKRGMEDAAIEMKGSTKKQVDRAVRFATDFVPIAFKEQVINGSMGRTSGINHAPREIYRPEFRDWSCTLLIHYDTSVITSQAIVALVNRAGFYSGLGDWRPGRGGDVFGMYQVIENGKK